MSRAMFTSRNFVDGIADGFTRLITQPINGAREEGAIGAVKGFAKGSIGLATKVPSSKQCRHFCSRIKLTWVFGSSGS